jgi:hypothetical protein
LPAAVTSRRSASVAPAEVIVPPPKSWLPCSDPPTTKSPFGAMKAHPNCTLP